MQAQASQGTEYTGFWKACKYLYRTEGASVFARGLVPNLVRSFPSNAAIFYVYEVLMKTSNDYLKARRSNSN
jgi:solute carrier family 25 carnitine/acylcarnitine transporter 20/29